MTRPTTPDAELSALLESIAGVEGWMSDDQARLLWERARALAPGATIVEIGSYRGRSAIVLARAAPATASVVAIDPHGGYERGPRQHDGRPEEGQEDHEAFLANLAAAGVGDRVRHVRKRSDEALDDVAGPIDLLYIDGAHTYRAARNDIRAWSARVPADGTVLIHDAFSSVGVTAALLRLTFLGGRLRYVGRARSMVELRVASLGVAERAVNAARQAAQLPWFLRNVVVKALLVARLPGVARALGHRDGPWPF
jgi:predicted O-methyltransferase YrrM